MSQFVNGRTEDRLDVAIKLLNYLPSGLGRPRSFMWAIRGRGRKSTMGCLIVALSVAALVLCIVMLAMVLGYDLVE